MKTTIIGLMTVALAVWAVVAGWPTKTAAIRPISFAAPKVQRLAPIKWNKSYSAAVAFAKKNHTLVMVDFYTDWCEWCKKMDTDVYPDQRVITAVDQFASVKLDAEKEGADLAEKYDVDGYPTILILDTQGNLVDRIEGYRDADAFTTDLQSLAYGQDANVE